MTYEIGQRVYVKNWRMEGRIKQIDPDWTQQVEGERPNYLVTFGIGRMWIPESALEAVANPDPDESEGAK